MQISNLSCDRQNYQKSFLGLQKGRKLKWANMFKMEKGRKLNRGKISAFTV